MISTITLDINDKRETTVRILRNRFRSKFFLNGHVIKNIIPLISENKIDDSIKLMSIPAANPSPLVSVDAYAML